MRRRRVLSLCAAAASMALLPVARASSPGAEAAAVPVPVLTAPPAGVRGHPLWDSYHDLAPAGYEEAEYLVSGTATDAGDASAPYTTRIIVSRPSDPARFNGTVLVDWVNVTAQLEIAVDTLLTRELLLREGFAYVHASVQAAGLCCTALTPKVWDPERYAAIDHPGDPFASDILTQIAQALRSPPAAGGLDPMGALGTGSVRRVIAAGQSQSAIRLAEYVSDWLPDHPEAVGLVDGILVHGNVPGEKSFAVGSPVKVLHLLTDFELLDDGVDPATHDPSYRLWEVAGAAHSDYWTGVQSLFGHGPRVTTGAAKLDEASYRALLDRAGNYGEIVDPLLAVCTGAGATMPLHYAASAAVHQLAGWVAGSTDPGNGPRVELADGRPAKDEHGNTLGGIRLPPIDVPVARYESTACQLSGITVPFSDAQIQALHGAHADYFAAMAARTDEAVAAGWLLPEDAVDLMRRACRASVRFGTPGAPCAPYTPPAYDTPLSTTSAPPGPTPGTSAGQAPANGARRSLPATGAAPAAAVGLALAATALAFRRAVGSR